MNAGGCSSCGAKELHSFFSVTGIPSHSCLLLPDRESARAFPKGDLELALCEQCGFIQNLRFDPSTQAFSAAYEETQGFSPTFQRFLIDLAEQTVQRYSLAGGSAFEIGCGKGEFLAALCAKGMARGTGYDPAFHPGRLEGPGADGVTVHRRLWTPEDDVHDADLIACRHTLEHIADVGDFVREVRTALDSSPATVLFELPCAERVLREAAFWDVYYEHCSYFTLGSLRRLFQQRGFSVLDARHVYGDQYIVLEAEPGPGPANDGDGDLEALRTLVDRFSREAPKAIAGWGERVRAAAERGPVALWGSGSKAVSFLTTTGLDEEVAAVVDINPHRHGRFMPGTGHRIDSPSRLSELQPGLVVLMNGIYEDEVRADLEKLSVRCELRSLR